VIFLAGAANRLPVDDASAALDGRKSVGESQRNIVLGVDAGSGHGTEWAYLGVQATI
jgi:hypothetical protein